MAGTVNRWVAVFKWVGEWVEGRDGGEETVLARMLNSNVTTSS